MSILTLSICINICESCEQNGKTFTLVLALKYHEPIAKVASAETEKSCAHFQEACECSYSLVCQALAHAVLFVNWHDHDRVHYMVH